MMLVDYGPNNLGWFGHYAYIYTQIAGHRMDDGTVVTTWAVIFDAEYYDSSTNSTHKPYGQSETAECRVIFK